jgi:CRP-like cAMP-binding protein
LKPDGYSWNGGRSTVNMLVLGTTPAGEFFVEAALFAETFHCDAVAAEPSQVRVYPKAAVLSALRADPASAM